MEKYLTPMQYEQYLHDTAYQAAINATAPTVTQVVVVVGIFVIAVIAWAIADGRRQKRLREQRKAAVMQREVDRHVELQKLPAKIARTCAENDDKWFQAGGSWN